MTTTHTGYFLISCHFFFGVSLILGLWHLFSLSENSNAYCSKFNIPLLSSYYVQGHVLDALRVTVVKKAQFPSQDVDTVELRYDKGADGTGLGCVSEMWYELSRVPQLVSRKRALQEALKAF